MRSLRSRTSLTIASLLAALVLAGAAPVSAATPAPIGDFRLAGTYKSRVASPLTLAALGTPAFQTVTVGTKPRTALVFAAGQGAELTGIPPRARATYTIDIWFRFDSAGCYQRVLSFGPNTSDDGLYICSGGPDLYPLSYQRAAVIQPGTFAHLRISRAAATKTAKIWVNGQLTNVALDLTNELILRDGTVDFFVDDGADNASGAVAGITFWNKVVAP